MTLPGVDLSSFNGLPSAWRAEAGKIQWAAVKISELSVQGSYLNPDAAADWDWLRQQGKGRIAYLFGHPGTSVAATVAKFVAEIRALGLADGDGAALDLEVSDGFSPHEVDAWGLEVLRELDAQLDRVPLIYSFPAFIEAGNCASLGAYPLWLANPSAAEGHPVVPLPWKDCSVQQYEISGSIDRDVAFYPDLTAMQAALGKRRPPDPPEPAKVTHWRTLGLWSLAHEAKVHRTTPAVMLRLAADAGHVYASPMKEYIEKGDWNARVPARTTLYAPEG